MADVTPPEPSGSGTTSGGNVGLAILGGIVALPVCLMLSLAGFFFWSWVTNQKGGASCLHGFVPGVATAVVAGLLLWFAWHMLVQNRSNGPGASFLRSFSFILAVFLLAPWPCSLTWMGVSAAAYCGH